MNQDSRPWPRTARCRLVELRVRRKGQEDHARLEEHLQLCSDPSFTTVSLVKKAQIVLLGNWSLMVFMFFLVKWSKIENQVNQILSFFFFLYLLFPYYFFTPFGKWKMTPWLALVAPSHLPGDPGAVPRLKSVMQDAGSGTPKFPRAQKLPKFFVRFFIVVFRKNTHFSHKFIPGSFIQS